MEIQKSDNRQSKRSRKRTSYEKVCNLKREKLIEIVFIKDGNLKKAAKELGIKYSTAKTILRIFKIERRIEKKNAISPDKPCKDVFVIKKIKKCPDTSSTNQSSIEIPNLKAQKAEAEKRSKDEMLRKVVEDSEALSKIVDEFNSQVKDFHTAISTHHQRISQTNVLIKELLNFEGKLKNMNEINRYASKVNQLQKIAPMSPFSCFPVQVPMLEHSIPIQQNYFNNGLLIKQVELNRLQNFHFPSTYVKPGHIPMKDLDFISTLNPIITLNIIFNPIRECKLKIRLQRFTNCM